MPLTDIQAEVLRLLARNRSPDSYVAGATVLHREESTPRYSLDLDLFHDLEESVATSAEADVATLRIRRSRSLVAAPRSGVPSRRRPRVGAASLRIEWAQDSAFRFYPVQPDDRFGYRLHDADGCH